MTQEQKIALDKINRFKKIAELKKQSEEINLRKWRTDPESWLKERFGEDPKAINWELWNGYDNHIWDGSKNPLLSIWQSVINNRHTALLSATGIGKTYIIARIIYWWLDCFENSKVYTSAPKEQQLVTQLWSEMTRCFYRFKNIRPYAEMNSLKLKVNAYDKQFSESWIAEGFVAGVRANEESTTKAQGLHGDRMLIITEETPGMPWPTMNAFINTSTGDNNRILALGNPDSKVDTLSLYIQKNKSVKTFRASAYDHPNIVTGNTVIQGAVSKISLQERLESYGEKSWFFESRGRGIVPEQSKDSLVKLEWINWCTIGTDQYEQRGNINYDSSSNAAGVDVANSETGDMGAVAFGRQNHLLYLREFRCTNATHLAYNLIMDDIDLISKGYENYNLPKVFEYNVQSEFIGVDPIGVGAATVNAFKDEGYNILSIYGGQNEDFIPKNNDGKPEYRFNSLRAQIYWMLAQDLMHRRILIDLPKDVIGQLEQELIVVKVQLRGGVIGITPKEEIKRMMAGKSPNLADAVAYWNYARKGAGISSTGIFAPMI